MQNKSYWENITYNINIYTNTCCIPQYSEYSKLNIFYIKYIRRYFKNYKNLFSLAYIEQTGFLRNVNESRMKEYFFVRINFLASCGLYDVYYKMLALQFIPDKMNRRILHRRTKSGRVKIPTHRDGKLESYCRRIRVVVRS